MADVKRFVLEMRNNKVSYLIYAIVSCFWDW
jgi:hypothetical protein